MWLDWIVNPGPLALESDVLPTGLCGLAKERGHCRFAIVFMVFGLLTINLSFSKGYLFNSKTVQTYPAVIVTF